MSFLGSLFDPVGAVATGGNNNTFNSVFSPGDNLFGDNGLGFEPSWQTNFTDSYSEPAGNFADNVMNVNEDELRNLGNHVKSNPFQFVTGVDPASTSFWNKVSGTNNSPWVNQYGGEAKQDYQNSANRGINTENGQEMGSLANMVAGWYGGQALAGLAGTAYGAATSAPTEEALINGDAAVGTGSNAGFAADTQAGSLGGYSGYAPAGAAGGVSFNNSAAEAAGRTVNGAAQNTANALDNNQNPFKAFAQGGMRAGLGSNLDYASGLGVDDPLYKAGINGALNGGVKTAMSDPSQSGYGALIGALGGLAGQAGPAVSKYLGSPSSGDGGASTGTTNWGNLATGLGNMYMASRNNAGIQSQINGLNSLYAPNSPYAQQLAQTLQRQDAASGRGSQYGTRGVELQARLADLASRNAPTLSNLYAQQRQNRFSQYAGMLGTARNSGVFSGLGGMFGNQGGQDPMSYVNSGQQSMPQYTGANDSVMSTVPPMIDPSQIYGG